jgi:hypothetical protein
MAAGDPGVLQRNYSAIAVETTLTASISASSQGASGTIIVGSVAGYPATAPYTLVLDPDTSREEVITVTANSSGTTLTVLRGQDNTQAVAHSAGSSVRHAVSARDFKEEKTHAAARGYDADQTILDLVGQTHVHGIVTGEGVVVGTLKAQTLTNKTIGSTGLAFEGSTDDGFETTLTVVDPTADRTITFPNTSGTVDIIDAVQTLSNKTLTSPIISGSPTITGLSSAGMVSSSATPKDYVDAILGSATAAATSAASAAASATAAATSASSASASATTAATSATAAVTSATSASVSATAAATSATSAATSASSALTSATSAATSATSAANSATTAAASVATIASYASAAATSATSASNSATAAATSAASAATSASTMAASVSAAATSATSAANSATAAATSATSAAASATAAATSATTATTQATAAATSATSAAASATAAATSATSAAASATAAASSATNAATTYDNFDDRYLGSKTSAPTVDNDGNTLLVGAIYWNSVLNAMYVWSGSTWVQIATTTTYTAPTIGSTTIASGTTYTTIAGLTLSSGLASADPTAALGLATKQYVDSVVTQINYHQAVKVATTSNIAVNYSNGSSGVGATLTADTLRAWTGLDGVSTGYAVGDRILIKDQTTQLQNGIYTITNLGSAGVTAWVLTRATDADNNPSGEMKNGDEVSCLSGTANGGKSFINSTSVDPIVIGTTAITFSAYYSSLPSQDGNSGKYLTTDGSVPSWGTVSSYLAPTLGTTVVTSNTTITTINGLTDVVLNGAGSVQDELTLILMGAL